MKLITTSWYILSAKHHRRGPSGPPIELYDETLTGAPVVRKREWAETVYHQLEDEGLLDGGNRLVFHAGRDYYSELVPLLSETPVDVATLTDGLQFGETLAWYSEHLLEPQAILCLTSKRSGMSRRTDLDRLYDLLDRLESNVGGKQRLEECTGYMDWPERGVYFFFADGETRESTDQLRLTRIGTHAVSSGSGTSLWNRLRTHRGAKSGSYEGGGNHRGSVFRKRVGEAIVKRDGLHEGYPHWGNGSSAARDRRLTELDLERRVSEYIRSLPFLWVNIDDEPGPQSDRAYVEQNTIALVSNYDRITMDLRADNWLGNASPRGEIRKSGLWNINHVEESYDPQFIGRLESAVGTTGAL